MYEQIVELHANTIPYCSTFDNKIYFGAKIDFRCGLFGLLRMLKVMSLSHELFLL